MFGGVPVTQLCLIGWNRKLFVSSTPLLSLTVFSLFLTAEMLHPFLSFIAIFMVTILLILLTACLPSSCGLAAQGFLLPLIPILSNSLMQELTSTLNHSSLSLVNSVTSSLRLVFPNSYNLSSFKREASRHLLP